MNDPTRQHALEHVPKAYRERFLEIVRLLDAFSQEYLDGEWNALFVQMAAPLCQKGSPALKGRAKSWAAGIIHTVGRINFLGDPSFEPHMTSDEVAQGVGVSKSNMWAKFKAIRDGLGIMPMDPDYTLPELLEQNPLVWMVEVNGLLMDIRRAPRELQETAFEQGAIPFVPSRPGPQQDEEPDPTHRAKIIRLNFDPQRN